LDTKLGGLQSRSGRGGEEKNSKSRRKIISENASYYYGENLLSSHLPFKTLKRM
jgi:hypothetical protein